jgi:hypothetical protein
MDNVLNKARAGQNSLEQLMNAIPGFSGYREKELRRDTDRIQREFLASRLESCKKALDGAAAAASRLGVLDAINDIETARKRLDKVTARIRYADRGYAGFFDAIKVKEDVLERVYQFDLDLVGGVDAVKGAADGAASDPHAIAAMIAALDGLDDRLSGRDTILSGIQ